MMILREGFTAQDIPSEIKEQITGVSYKENDNIKLHDLSYLRVKHYDLTHTVREGELIVNRRLAEEVLEIFAELFDNEYEIEKIRLVENYGADDDLSMADNNSSAFNYRVVSGTQTVSAHGYGRAIDINPLYNPYIVGDKIMPPNGAPYADRSKQFPYKIDENDLCYKVFTRRGWRWGGHWKTQKDYQHFYKERKHPVRTVIRRIRQINSNETGQNV